MNIDGTEVNPHHLNLDISKIFLVIYVSILLSDHLMGSKFSQTYKTDVRTSGFGEQELVDLLENIPLAIQHYVFVYALWCSATFSCQTVS